MSTSEPLVQSVLLGEAVEHAPVAILVADDEMRYVAANATASELLGYTREELLQLRITDLAQYPEAEGEFEAMISAGELIGRTKIRHKDGSVRSLRHRSSETKIAGLAYYVAVLWPDS
ncbi:MAG TPA: PAS domain-containing protein [Gaiellaceae bacterium]|jgi:PAS domain S-box-containing protein|nr:PAS domain-containing protein [Gaiellaceae bacterium]